MSFQFQSAHPRHGVRRSKQSCFVSCSTLVASWSTVHNSYSCSRLEFFRFDGPGVSTIPEFAIPRDLLDACKVCLHCLWNYSPSHLNAAVLMCQWFAPTKLVITFETKGEGRFTPEEIQSYSIKNNHGDIVALNFPSKFVLIANHQVCRWGFPNNENQCYVEQIYADWWYAWCLTYFLSPRKIHQHVYITLKKSLQWVPVVGWVRRSCSRLYGLT